MRFIVMAFKTVVYLYGYIPPHPTPPGGPKFRTLGPTKDTFLSCTFKHMAYLTNLWKIEHIGKDMGEAERVLYQVRTF